MVGWGGLVLNGESSVDICDPFCENLRAETKVGNNFILYKYLKPIFSSSPIIALPL